MQNVGSVERSNEGINEVKSNIQHVYTFIIPLIVKTTTYRNKKIHFIYHKQTIRARNLFSYTCVGIKSYMLSLMTTYM